MTLAAMAFFGSLFFFGRPVRAGESEETEESAEAEREKTEEEILREIETHRNGIVHIESICWDGENDIYRTKSFSGFVVSGNSSGIYVVTVNRKLTYTSKEKEKIKEKFGLENNARVSEKIEVIFNGDLRIEAEIAGESSQRNLTVLRLNQNVNFENIPQFAKENASDKEKVYLLSYPKSVKQNGGIYNEENVKITAGTIRSSFMEEEIEFLEHDIQTDSSSLGGPLFNEDGAIAGVLLTSGETGGTAIGSDSVREFLKTLNVAYEEYEEMVVEKKLPIVNILLGVVILVLFLAVIIRMIKNRSEQEREKRGKSVKNERGKDKKGKTRLGRNVHAWLEYPSEQNRVNIQKTIFVIGRAEEADLCLEGNKEISRAHASIQYDGKDFYLKDMQSRNHTFLNGYQLIPDERKRLKDGDRIRLGSEEMTFRM